MPTRSPLPNLRIHTKTRAPEPTGTHRTRERATGLLVLLLIIAASTWLALRVYRVTAEPASATRPVSD